MIFDKKKVFYVEFPLYRYKEDVKALALKKGFRIVDKRFQGGNKQPSGVPKLTLKLEFKKETEAK